MATCTVDNLVATSAFGQLPPHKRKALMVFMLIQELAALGGTDYTSDFSALLSDAAPFSAMRQDQREGALIEIFKENAVAAGATIPDDINDLMAEAACIDCSRDLDLLILILTCALGEHA